MLTDFLGASTLLEADDLCIPDRIRPVELLPRSTGKPIIEGAHTLSEGLVPDHQQRHEQARSPSLFDFRTDVYSNSVRSITLL